MTSSTAARPVILDGGLSNALEARGHVLGGDLWTARLLRDSPEAIADVHRDYFAAGADVATTASYQASVPGLVAAGSSQREAERLIRLSVRLAKEVAAEGEGRLVAASVGPYAATLADGSEYRGYRGRVPKQVLREFHAPRLELLAEEEPDLIAVETLPDAEEAEVLVELLQRLEVPSWLSFSADGEQTRAGQSLKDAFALATASPIVAVGVNCCDPADAEAAVELAVSTSGRPAVCYPNSGQGWNSGVGEDAGHWTGERSWDVSAAAGWVAAGATYVGGCCQVGPEQIAALAAQLNR
ncbi:homocysteine S-methyltransferase [Nocardioides sp. Kera G14]|uniref:homocysteine S-methyltransferase n=1 Tax=Nocardioides sp. Kera G14 TaxID=2884264 RepID=UPI001D12537A|nr:homocysteine S-methyltransferase [Nocardioides sp. Kera G14]UDY22475.1 homocysteine S-methyltransferase [Nocardioides sp. Kera G14]